MPDTAERIGENDTIEFVPVHISKGSGHWSDQELTFQLTVSLLRESAVNEAMLTGESNR